MTLLVTTHRTCFSSNLIHERNLFSAYSQIVSGCKFPLPLKNKKEEEVIWLVTTKRRKNKNKEDTLN